MMDCDAAKDVSKVLLGVGTHGDGVYTCVVLGYTEQIEIVENDLLSKY